MAHAHVVGGFGAVKHADDTSAGIIAKDEVRAALRAKVGADLASVEVLGYKTQVVAGTNFKLHVKVNGTHEYTVRIHRSLDAHAPLEVQGVDDGGHL